MLYANFTVTEKDSAQLKVGQTVRIVVDAYPGRTFEGKITTIEPQIATDTRNIRVQATIANPDHILKPGMFATTTVVLPDKPPVVTVPETAVDYTLYGDSVFLITEKKADDGKTSLTAVRTFVRTGNRIDGPRRNPQRPEARRSRGGGRPAQAAIGMRRSRSRPIRRRRFRRSRRATSAYPEATTAFPEKHESMLRQRSACDGLDRYLHQATGAVGGRQPADPADRLQGRDHPADPAISETVEYRGQRHDGLSRRVGRI